MLRRAALIWFGILVLAVMNGALREGALIPAFGEMTGHVLSTVLLCAAILVVAWLSMAWMGPRGRTDAVRIGLLWTVMTIAFEFLAGHYLFGTPWPELLADYNVAAGRIWPLVLMTTAVAPALMLRAAPVR